MLPRGRAAAAASGSGRGPGSGTHTRGGGVLWAVSKRSAGSALPRLSAVAALASLACANLFKMSSTQTSPDPAQALADVLARIAAARSKALAPAPSTTLVAVTKTVDENRIRPTLQAGHRVFGENRVQ